MSSYRLWIQVGSVLVEYQLDELVGPSFTKVIQYLPKCLWGMYAVDLPENEDLFDVYNFEPLLGGGTCSLLLLQSPLLLTAPFNFLPFAPFLLFPCSFFIFLCSLLLFHFSSCSMLLFQIFHCSILLFTILGAPCSRITLDCSLILYLYYGMLLAPLCQIGPAPGLPLMGVHFHFAQNCPYKRMCYHCSDHACAGL